MVQSQAPSPQQTATQAHTQSIAPPLPAIPQWALNGSVPSNLQSLGLLQAPTQLSHARIIIDISGQEKTGKSFTALSSTAPVFYLTFDPRNIEGVVEEFRRTGKPIVIGAFPLPLKGDQAMYVQIYDRFLRTAQELAKEPRGTIVVDTGRALEELVRLNLYGKLKGVGTFSYEQRNAEMEGAFNLLHDSKLNVIWVHNMRKGWAQYTDQQGAERSRPTGQWEPDRFELVGQRVQINAKTYREVNPQGGPGNFHLYIENCRLKSALGGRDVTIPTGSMMTIPGLMAEIFGGNPVQYM